MPPGLTRRGQDWKMPEALRHVSGGQPLSKRGVGHLILRPSKKRIIPKIFLDFIIYSL
jgi:hypothetical protein